MFICIANTFGYSENSTHFLLQTFIVFVFNLAEWMSRDISGEDLTPCGSKPLKHPHLFSSESSATEIWVLGIDQDQEFEGEMRSRSAQHHMAEVQLTVGVWVSFNAAEQTNKQNMLYFGK